MELGCKSLAWIIFGLTAIPIIAYGRFDNEFLRLNIILASCVFTYFSNEHYLIRLIVNKIQPFLIKFSGLT